MVRIVLTLVISSVFLVLGTVGAQASAILELSSTSKNPGTEKNVSEAYLYVESISEPNPLFESGKYEAVVRVLGTKPVLMNPNMPEQGYYLDKIGQYKGAKIKVLTSMRIAKLSEKEMFHLGGKNVKAYMIMNNEDSFVIKNIKILPDNWSVKELETASAASASVASGSAKVDKDAGVVLQ